MESKVNKKLIIGISAAVIAVITIIAIIGFNVFSSASKIVELNEELATLNQKQLGEDNFNTEIKTSGDYGKVEKTIKEYLQKYSDTIKSISEESAKVAELQGATEKDKLEEKKNEVIQIRTNMENNINALIEMSSEENIIKAIEKEGLAQKYVDLYKQFMIGNLSSKLEKQKESMSKSKDQILELFDKFIESYDYLLEHKDSWEIENNQIAFSNSTHLREYNKIIQEIQSKARLMALSR